MMKLIGLILWAIRVRTFDATPEERRRPCVIKISPAPRFDATRRGTRRRPASSVDHVEFGYSVAYASGKFVVGAREIGAEKIGAAFLYSM